MLNMEESKSPDNDRQVPTVKGTDASAQSAGASQKRIDANHRNALLSTGPRNTESTRYNATKHGLLSKGVTELDNHDDYEETIRYLTIVYCPLGPVERFLIERVALDIVRAQRIARLEAEYISGMSNRATASTSATPDRCTPMIDPMMMKEYLGPLLGILQRYDSAIMNRLLRGLRELERLRQGELLPGRTGTDIAIDADGTVTI